MSVSFPAQIIYRIVSYGLLLADSSPADYKSFGSSECKTHPRGRGDLIAGSSHSAGVVILCDRSSLELKFGLSRGDEGVIAPAAEAQLPNSQVLDLAARSSHAE